MKNRILEQTVLLSADDERDYELKVRVKPVIPPVRGQSFAAKPVSLLSLRDRSALPIGVLLDSFGVTENHATRACVEEVEQFLMTRTERA